MTETDERLIGKLEAHVEDLRVDVKAMRHDITMLKSMVEQARGAKWALATLATLFGGFGSLLAAWITGVFKTSI